MTGRITLTSEGAIARVTLSHPGKLNAMSRAMWREMKTVFDGIHLSSDYRCVVLAGEGDAFCAGGDISEYPDFRFDENALRQFHEGEVWGGLKAMLDCDIPIVAQISGACIGAGLEIASCCDLRIAGEGAKFGAPIAKLGFPMAPREAEVVARAAGDVTVREMLFEAAVLTAAEMKSRGFLTRVTPDAGVAAEAAASAARIAELSPQAARLNKRTLRSVSAGAGTLAQAYRYANSAEHREGIAAFLEKRPARF
ncbi:enoyl-CoA hydratase/isomerase family protein [Caenimonas aquaedulcis]|uniref:Enoyl-CoA hydratase/isomerase family protein n=1 Tax=Caenimonas aquaedulcis TaxID=2793270 RepID=A0A931H2J8_9BURK|nr:enoyl-CoA hydratase/isomerase family protein [Caenimonas aquaedulcis]MBG9387429.1 enoyl-CoA hydratase/isomerase family protein [Caenimonas aquaedulcis]